MAALFAGAVESVFEADEPVSPAFVAVSGVLPQAAKVPINKPIHNNAARIFFIFFVPPFIYYCLQFDYIKKQTVKVVILRLRLSFLRLAAFSRTAFIATTAYPAPGAFYDKS